MSFFFHATLTEGDVNIGGRSVNICEKLIGRSHEKTFADDDGFKVPAGSLFPAEASF